MMTRLAIVLVVASLCSGTAVAKLDVAVATTQVRTPSRANTVFWFDDIESGEGAWAHVDFSPIESHFHWDTYMAYQSQSWWCGSFDYDADGGYGNSWDDRLSIPPVDWTGYTDPILTYAFRHDSEAGYDFTWVQAESNGFFVNMTGGYDGTQPWTDIGLYGFSLQTYDNPLNARFRFISDGAWSDEDGSYLSVGGAFACDDIRVFDYFTGHTFFYDSEPGTGPDEGECVPSGPDAAGDWWHIISRRCPALSDPHSWWCGDDADTSLVPPNLQNGLYTPVVAFPFPALSCTVRFATHFAVPTVDNDYIAYYGTCDGATYYGIGAYWGDFGQCDGWGLTAYNIGFDVGQFCAPTFWNAGFLFIMYTTDNGCGPGAGGDAGVMIDDIWMEGVEDVTGVAGEATEMSWSRLKSLYR